jgi:hypothetical protein
MRDVGKLGLEVCGWVGLPRTAGRETLWGNVCSELRSRNLAGILALPQDSVVLMVVELFWTSGSSSVKWSQSHRIITRKNSLRIAKVIHRSEYMKPKRRI